MKRTLFLYTLLLQVVFGFSQELLPFVENYTKADYKGDNQNWGVVQGSDGAMYFANTRFFVRYNGVIWEKYALPNKTIIRSLFVDGAKIYTGSYTEFGFWERKKGVMHYTSLSKDKNLFLGNSNNEEIWKIFKSDNLIYFQSFNELFIYDFSTIKKVRIPFQISYCFQIDGIIYVASVRDGMYIYKNNTFQKIDKWHILENKIVHGIEKHNGQLYIFTQKDGVFIEKNGVLKAWNLELNAQLKKETITTAKSINDVKLVIGTSLKGVYLVDTATKTTTNINKNNALNNNSVLSITADKEQNLWLGLDNGIAHIEINSPITIFTDNTGLLGSVYALQPTETGYLLGSNHGVFEWKNKVLKSILNSQGQVWDIQKVDNQYIIGHNDGTFVYENGQYTKANSISGGWKLFKSQIDNKYYQSNYSGILIYDNPIQLNNYQIVENLSKPIKNMAQNKIKEIWAVDNYRSLFRISFSEDFKTNTVENISQKNGLINDFGVKIFNFKNELFFYINQEWYQYNSLSERLEKSALFNQHFNAISDIIPVDEQNFVVIKDNTFYLIAYKNQSFYWKVIPQKYYEGKIINQDTKAVKTNESLLLNLDDGFLKVGLFSANSDNMSIKVEGFYENKFIDEASILDYNQTIELHVLSTKFGFYSPRLFYKRNDTGDFIAIEGNKIILNNLSSGNQVVSFYLFDGTKYKAVTTYSFGVSNPWYFSFWMLFAYFTVIGAIFYLYYRWNKIRYTAKLKVKEEELNHLNQMEQLEVETTNKLKMQDYEKHILEIQVQTKASEVAGKSLSIAKQSEMIDSIEHILANESDTGQIKSKIKKAIKSNSINKNEWQIFEKNLMKSHEDFVSKLTNSYPNLTSKDIKLCIFLRMNLASKEIAPLMNISYRGVELHRYRLRKKLDIAKENNLSNFMIKL
jgi:DNA-binding CsgD family transcriptional regulator